MLTGMVEGVKDARAKEDDSEVLGWATVSTSDLPLPMGLGQSDRGDSVFLLVVPVF